MHSENNKSVPSPPPLCVEGCGCFGSARTRNMCPECYMMSLSTPVILVAVNPSRRQSAVAASASRTTPSPVSAAAMNRCEICRKKVRLIGFTCRCGKLLCGTHRYPNEHYCSFDFKTLDRNILARQNPVVKADKFHNSI